MSEEFLVIWGMGHFLRSLGGRNSFLLRPAAPRANWDMHRGAKQLPIGLFLPIHRLVIGDYADSPPAPSFCFVDRSTNALLFQLLSDLLLLLFRIV